MEYSASMVSRPYLFKATRKAAILIIEGKSLYDIKNLSLKDNIFQIDSESRRKEITGTVCSRIKNIDKLILEKIAYDDIETSKILVVYILMKHNRLFFEFINEVYREKILLREDKIEAKDFNMFFDSKKEQSEKVNSWKEYTFKKLKVVFTNVIVESGLVNNNHIHLEIKKPLLNTDLVNYIISIGDKVYINALECID